jgi:hypothetical protein
MKRRKKRDSISGSIYGSEHPLWVVTFIGDYATITTSVQAQDEDDAIVLAENVLTDYYDLDMSGFGGEAVLSE